MRRSRDPRPGTFFRGGELPRLAMLIMMLALIGLLISRARDPAAWSWLTSEDFRPGPPAASTPQRQPEPASQTTADEPLDRDVEEISAAREELGAVGDRSPLTKEEMPAYWRLVRWERSQPAATVRSRARADVLFTHLWEHPEKYRGQLIRLNLHLRRGLSYETEEAPAGVKRMYEAWGFADEGPLKPYVVVFSDLPRGMPLEANMEQEATFAGYFFKLMSYESQEGNTLAAPLLIGKLIWHPLPGYSRDGQTSGASWLGWLGSRGTGSAASPWLLLAGSIVALSLVYRILKVVRRRADSRAQRSIQPSGTNRHEQTHLDQWLSQAEGAKLPDER